MHKDTRRCGQRLRCATKRSRDTAISAHDIFASVTEVSGDPSAVTVTDCATFVVRIITSN